VGQVLAARSDPRGAPARLPRVLPLLALLAIAGFSQRQVPGGAMVFTTLGGSISLSSLSAVAGWPSQQAQSSASGSQRQQQLSTGFAPMTGMAPLTSDQPGGSGPGGEPSVWLRPGSPLWHDAPL
jgi:hypothetical protein